MSVIAHCLISDVVFVLNAQKAPVTYNFHCFISDAVFVRNVQKVPVASNFRCRNPLQVCC